MDPISRGIRTGVIVAICATGDEVRIASQAPTDPPLYGAQQLAPSVAGGEPTRPRCASGRRSD